MRKNVNPDPDENATDPQHNNEVQIIPDLSFNATFFELQCTLRAKLHPMSYTAPCDLRSTPLSWAVF